VTRKGIDAIFTKLGSNHVRTDIFKVPASNV